MKKVNKDFCDASDDNENDDDDDGDDVLSLVEVIQSIQWKRIESRKTITTRNIYLRRHTKSYQINPMTLRIEIKLSIFHSKNSLAQN